jgi:hypothetical protein
MYRSPRETPAFWKILVVRKNVQRHRLSLSLTCVGMMSDHDVDDDVCVGGPNRIEPTQIVVKKKPTTRVDPVSCTPKWQWPPKRGRSGIGSSRTVVSPCTGRPLAGTGSVCPPVPFPTKARSSWLRSSWIMGDCCFGCCCSHCRGRPSTRHVESECLAGARSTTSVPNQQSNTPPTSSATATATGSWKRGVGRIVCIVE